MHFCDQLEALVWRRAVCNGQYNGPLQNIAEFKSYFPKTL